MIISQLLQLEIQEYINQNLDKPISKIALQKNPFPHLDFKIIVNQLEAKFKARHKLPTWFICKNILYPSKISIEQSSSEVAANYKASLVTAQTLIDLTGGFGVDDYYFAKTINQVIHCEINSELSKIVTHNFNQLNVSNVTFIQGDSKEILEKLNQQFDTIYIDPSRRNDAKGKVFMLKDCFPSIPELQDFYFKYSNKILLKTAPILDITAALSELKNVKTIHIVAIKNEVKELLWEIEKNYANTIEIKTINFNKDKKEIFNFEFNSNEISSYSLPQKYLYEPNSAIMKSGGFNEVGNSYLLQKLHQHSHLYTSNEKKEFPGRVFEILKIIEYSKNTMKEFLENTKYNITIRNFPEKVENIRKKWKINEGGNHYCFFTTNKNDTKIVLICTKI